MERTVVAVFDSRQEAQAAWQDVVACGIDEARVHLREGTIDDVPGAKLADEAIRRAGWTDLLATDEEGQYREALRRGSCLVAVDPIPQEKAIDVAAALSRHNPINLDDRAAGWREPGWQGHDTSASRLGNEELRTEREHDTRRAASRPAASQQDELTIPVIEEELAVGKRMVERGGVRIFTRVTDRPVEETVTLREERARVERRDVDRPASEADLGAAFKEGSMEIRETREEPVVSKEARVVGEVEVGKEVTERQQTVKDTVRRSDVEVEELPGSRTGATDKPRTTRRP
jgi:stress response protein YsnF